MTQSHSTYQYCLLLWLDAGLLHLLDLISGNTEFFHLFLLIETTGISAGNPGNFSASAPVTNNANKEVVKM